MPRFDFDVMREKKRNHFDRSKAIRLVILFCVIAAITALVIYAIIPKSELTENAPQESSPAENSAAENTPDQNAPAPSGEVQEVPPSGNTPGNSQDPGASDSSDASSAADTTTAAGSAGQSSASQDGKSENTAKYDPSADELSAHTRLLRRQLNDGSWKSASFAIRHIVRGGDRVVLLANQYRTNSAFIRKYNNLNENNEIITGQELFFINAPDGWQITISKSRQTLQIDRIVNKQHVPFAIFRCQNSSRLPLRSDLVICQRRVRSEYRDNQGRIFENGSTGNPYGEYRITLAAAARPDAPYLHWSIHDAGDQDVLAAVLRDGSMILAADDIELLYLLIPKGTPVRIIE